MVFTKCSILNRGSPFGSQRTERMELHLGREHSVFRV